MNASGQPAGIAMIGMAGRFPGADSVDALWRNLLAGIDGISTLSDAELDAAGVPPEVRRDPHYVPRQGVLAGFDHFDADFFGYSAFEAARLDPQHRIFLEVAWDALEHAGIDPARYAGQIGLYGGCGVPTYLLQNLFRGTSVISDDPAADFAMLIGNDKDFLTTRVAYKLDLTGPVVTVQTACSTSLVATHMACQALLAYECDVAMAGGVTITVPHGVGYRHQDGMILSADGRGRAFDAAASGAVFGSGCGVVVLKRLADALADGDLIDAVILGTAINNDGSAKAGYTAPGVSGQVRVIALAQEVAEIDPASIGYIEAHGTGTPLGDPIEAAALAEAFRRSTAAVGYCRLGTIKNSIGHLDTAAGVAGLIKTALAVREGEIPRTLHVTASNPVMQLERTPFVLATERQPWPDLGNGQRVAGVSAFGIGGTNAHVVIGQPPTRLAPTEPWNGPGMLVLSARSPAALAATATKTAAFLKDSGSGASLADLCGSAMHRRAMHRWRVAVAGRSVAGLAAALDARAPSIVGDATLDVERLGGVRRTVFVFPGQGSQWIGMGRDLLASEPVFRQAIADCARAFAPWTDWDLHAVLSGDVTAADFERIDVLQPALFAMQVALAALWRDKGLIPDAVLGHSMGEAAAAAVSGALSLDDAARVICRRSALLRTVSNEGAMMAVDIAAEAAERELRETGSAGVISVAVVNGASSCVLSGDRPALERLAATLEAKGASTTWVKVNVASHGPQMDRLEQPLRAALAGVQPRKPAIPFFSTVTGSWVADAETDADYWWRNLRHQVRFHDAVLALSAAGYGVFVEASPHPVLMEPVRTTLAHAGRPVLATGTLRRDADAVLSLATAAGRLFGAGQSVPLEPWLPACWRFTRLPSYAWEHRRYWIDSVLGQAARASPLPRTGEAKPETADPRDPAEQRLGRLWGEMLGTPPAGRDVNFFLSGGHSLLALQLLKRIQAEFGIPVTVPQLLQAPTPGALAPLLRTSAAGPAVKLPPELLSVQPNGDRPPLFMATPIMGTAFPYFPLAAALGPAQPFYALIPSGMQDGGRTVASIEGQVCVFADAIDAVRPAGPIHVGGWSFGALVAFELARELDRRGRTVAATLLIDTPAQLPGQLPKLTEAARFLFGTVLANMWTYIRSYLTLRRGAGADGLWAMVRVYVANGRAAIAYRPKPWRGSVTLLRTATSGTGADATEDWGWSWLAEGDVRVFRIPGNHMTLLQPPHLETVAGVIAATLVDQLAGKPPKAVHEKEPIRSQIQ
jgi:acyl transferase domain-containing protein/thioesterase domain-containing protein